MNITEKIIARASNRTSVSPGDVVFANVDKLMIHDVSGPGVIKVFDEWAKRGIQLDKYGMQIKYGYLKIILFLLQIEFPQRTSQGLRIGHKNLELKSISSTVWDNMESAIHFRMKRP